MGQVPIIFLDLDGVLNSFRLLLQLSRTDPTEEEVEYATKIATKYYHGYPVDMLIHDLRSIDPLCVEYLNQIIEASDADAVLSSTWRFSHSISGLQKLLEFRGFKGELIDITPVNVKSPAKLRGYEIQAWLDLNPEVESMVILDDDTDMAHLSSHLVRTDLAVGLTKKDAQRAISILLEPVRPVRT